MTKLTKTPQLNRRQNFSLNLLRICLITHCSVNRHLTARYIGLNYIGLKTRHISTTYSHTPPPIYHNASIFSFVIQMIVMIDIKRMDQKSRCFYRVPSRAHKHTHNLFPIYSFFPYTNTLFFLSICFSIRKNRAMREETKNTHNLN